MQNMKNVIALLVNMLLNVKFNGHQVISMQHNTCQVLAILTSNDYVFHI